MRKGRIEFCMFQNQRYNYSNFIIWQVISFIFIYFLDLNSLPIILSRFIIIIKRSKSYHPKIQR